MAPMVTRALIRRRPHSRATLPPQIALRYPDLYADWERDKPHTIQWDTYGNTADQAVRIDLYQDGPDGPTFVATIAAATPDDGQLRLDAGQQRHRVWYVRPPDPIAVVGDTIAVDRSTETFVVPENMTEFYVNDRDGSPTAGNNRNTGKLPICAQAVPEQCAADLYARPDAHAACRCRGLCLVLSALDREPFRPGRRRGLRAERAERHGPDGDAYTTQIRCLPSRRSWSSTTQILFRWITSPRRAARTASWFAMAARVLSATI